MESGQRHRVYASPPSASRILKKSFFVTITLCSSLKENCLKFIILSILIYRGEVFFPICKPIREFAFPFLNRSIDSAR